jgi:hypothetical protein
LYVEPDFLEDQSPPEPSIGWAWFEREPIERLADVEHALESMDNHGWIDQQPRRHQEEIPEEVWNRNGSWWTDHDRADSQPTRT